MVYPFNYYLKKKLVKRSKSNANEAQALLKRAKARMGYVENQEIKEDNAVFIFEDIYEALREAIQSLLAMKGYKPYSHEALAAFMKEFYQKEFTTKEIETFNRYRIIRNNIVYRASSIDAKEAEKALQYVKKMISKIEKIH
jgi:uncharacterized protein (UPF0332 family)